MNIRRVDLDGSGDQQVWSGSSVTDLALDLVNSYIYWSDGGTIYRSPLSSALVPTPVIVTGNTVTRIAVDVGGGMVYYLDTTAFEIRRVPVSGGAYTSVVSASGYGVAVDPFEAKVYWSVETGGTINRIDVANTNGSGGAETVVSETSTASS